MMPHNSLTNCLYIISRRNVEYHQIITDSFELFKVGQNPPPKNILQTLQEIGSYHHERQQLDCQFGQSTCESKQRSVTSISFFHINWTISDDCNSNCPASTSTGRWGISFWPSGVPSSLFMPKVKNSQLMIKMVNILIHTDMSGLMRQASFRAGQFKSFFKLKQLPNVTADASTAKQETIYSIYTSLSLASKLVGWQTGCLPESGESGRQLVLQPNILQPNLNQYSDSMESISNNKL